ncbi:MAG: hypothetical protein DRQ37_06785 [Gammaproteobacteria bacterium]|nr:MAG: hypothetical protein DRQ37_06785 [Gammaproteobacteria bacterium]
MMEIPGFKVLKTIGKGGMATVYLAVQESLEREVVLKTLNTANTENTDFSERFLNEGKVVASLRHPNIVTVYDIGATDDLLYISMEYVDGGDLKARLVGGVSVEETLDLIVKIADALDMAHRSGTIHRDVKPANILFRADRQHLLGDFGIAKQMEGDSELTSTGTILGSPFYMSPEQAEGMLVDGRTDIYSLGVIFYEMLTGERPFKGETPVKVILQHLQAPIPTLPEDLNVYQPLLEKMLAKDREERFADAGALVRYIEKFRGNGTAATADAPSGVVIDTLVLEPRVEGTEEETQPARVTKVPGDKGGRAGLGLAEIAKKRPSLRIGKQTFWLSTAGLALIAAGWIGAVIYSETLKRSSVLTARTQPIRIDTPATTAVPPTQLSQPVTGGTVPAPRQRAELTGEPVKDDVVRALAWLGRNSLEQGRLTDPPRDNAHYYFSRLLALDPNNAQGLNGFEKIAERYVVLAEKQFANKNFELAEVYVRLGLQVQPSNQGLLSLQSFMKNREKSFIDNIIEFFRG